MPATLKYSLDTFGKAARTAYGTRGNGVAEYSIISGGVSITYRPLADTGGPWWDPRYTSSNLNPNCSGRLVGVLDYAISSTDVSLPDGSHIIMGSPIPANRRVIAVEMTGNGMGASTSSTDDGTLTMLLYDSGNSVTYTMTGTVPTFHGTAQGGLVRTNANTFFGGGVETVGLTFMVLLVSNQNWNVAGGQVATYAEYIDV